MYVLASDDFALMLSRKTTSLISVLAVEVDFLWSLIEHTVHHFSYIIIHNYYITEILYIYLVGSFS